ncbi:retrovirus-related Pol polyprotein from transposon opus [Trichonephila clavipes]|nr:retrovirus-related Pol polyprotein from transposon opus [Trichonephila clavipes]
MLCMSQIFADPFILGLDFLKEHGFTLDFNKNELRSIHEEVTIFKIKHRTESIRQLKEALTSSPILIYPQPDKPFILDTDASNESVGAVLSQEIDGQERVVAYWSKCLSKPERNYCVTRKELLAIVKAIEHFHHYLYGQKFLLRTDHASFNLANEF